MNKISKDDYLLRNISKIKHKKWELYIITRILHLLNDENIEYVCQQFVKSKSGKRYLADLCFPTLKLYYEIDELQHISDKHKFGDAERKKEIIDATNFVEKRIKIYNHLKRNRKLKDINYEVDKFIEYVKNRKKYFELKGEKFIWDYKKKYNPIFYIKKGYLDVNDNVGFLTQRDCKICFGYKGGHAQRAVWEIKDKESWLWFPKLYKNKDWDNDITPDHKIIISKRTDRKKMKENRLDNILVFAHNKNIFGKTLYKFMGLFKYSDIKSDNFKKIFIRHKTKINLSKYSI